MYYPANRYQEYSNLFGRGWYPDPTQSYHKEFTRIQGIRDGVVVKALTSPHCGPDSIPRPGVICWLSLLLLFLVLAPGCFSRSLSFSLSAKTNFLKFHSDQETVEKSHLLNCMLLSPIYFKNCIAARGEN